MARKYTSRETAQPQSLVEPLGVHLTENERISLGSDLMMQIEQGVGDRNQFNINLDYYDQLYDMHVEQKDVPWPDSSNVSVPYIAMAVDTIAARLASLVFQPRFLVVSGNTEEAAHFSHIVERYYNAEIVKNNWRDPLFLFVQHALLYGTGVLGVFWKRKSITRKRRVYQGLSDPNTGVPVTDPITGEQMRMPQVVSMSETLYDNVELVPIPLRDFVMFPSWAMSVDDALGVARVCWLSEAQLDSMVRMKSLVASEVEAALSYVPEGMDSRTRDFQGIPPAITADDSINISDSSPNASMFRKQRGPIKVWQVFTKQYDLDGDGEPEENIFWINENTRRCLGYEPYKYWMGVRPFVLFTPMPRTQLAVGYSVPDRLRTIQEELNTQLNQTNDAIDRAISPPIVVRQGAELRTPGNRNGPDAQWEVPGEPNEYIWYPQVPQPPLANAENQMQLKSMGLELLGLMAPFTRGGASSRRSAKEAAIQAASAGVRIDLMAERLRHSLRGVFQRIHELKIQFGPEGLKTTEQVGGNTQQLIVPKPVLAQDYDMFVNGSGGPLDRSARAQDMMVLYALLMKNPLLSGNLQRIYALTRTMLEEHNRPDVQAIIGTAEEAQQQQQAMQQQQALQGELAAQRQRQMEQQQQRPVPAQQAPPQGPPFGAR